MTKSDLEKIREELKKQKEQNDNNILLYDERTRMAQVSQFKSKAEHTLAFSTISYFALLSASAVLINKIGADTFTSIIPAVSYSPILALGSVSIGSIIKGVMDKKFKTKERFKAFSTAKTQAEKLEEEIYYQIELEKTENRNKVIDETISILNSKEIMLWKRSVNYDINVKDLSEEEMRKAIDDLSEYIKTQYSKLDLLTAQKILHDRFRDTRATEYKIGDMIVATGSSIIVPGFLSVFPNLLLKDNMFTYGSTSLALVASFTPLIAGVAGVSIYKAKEVKIIKKLFKN